MVRQSSLCYKDLTLDHIVVSSTSVRCASDILEKCVHSVVLLCSICRNLYRTKSIRGRHRFSVFIRRKLLLNHFQKLMVNMLHRKIRVKDDYDVTKVVTLTQDKKEDKEHRKLPKTFKGVDLQALLDERDS